MFDRVKSFFSLSAFLWTTSLTLCLLSCFLFNTGSDFWGRQLHGIPFQISCLAAGFAGLIVWLATGRKSMINGLDVAVLFFIGYTILRPVYGNGLSAYQQQVFGPMSNAIVFVVIRAFFTSRDSWPYLIIAFVTVGLLNASVALLQFCNIVPINNDLGRVNGLFVNPGSLGGFLACLLPLFLLEVKTAGFVWAKRAIFILFIAVILMTASRASWIAAAVPFVIYFLRNSKKIKIDFTWITVTLLFVAAALVAFLLYQLNAQSVHGRLLIWKVAIRMFSDAPYFGHGPGSVAAKYNLYQSYYFASASGTPQEKLVAGTVYTVLNDYLNILIEGGLVGLMLFGGILFYFFKALSKAGPALLPICLCVCTILLSALFSYPFEVEANSFLFFSFLGICSSGLPPIRQFRLRWTAIAVIPCCLYLFVPPYRTVVALRSWKQGASLWDYNEYQAGLSYGKSANALHYNWAFLYNYGAELSRRGYRVKAVQVLQQCRRVGENYLVNNQLGQAYENIAHYQAAEACYRRAADMVPVMLSQKYALFKLYERQGQWDKYLKVAAEIQQTPVKIQTQEARLIKEEITSSIIKYKKKKNEKQI